MDIEQVQFPLDIPQYATFRDSFQMTYLDGTPVDLTNWTAKMQVRKSHGDSAVVVTLGTADGSIVITGSTGMIQFLLPATVTKTLPAPFKGVYDLLLFAPAPDPTVSRILQGDVCISAGVTIP